MAEPEVPVRNAATVIVVRDRPDGAGIETLLLRRSAELVFHGGSWVFPGGRIDAGDYPTDRPEDHEAAAAAAASREAQEEAGIVIDPGSLVPWAHWTTPPGRPRRFSTWFFLAPLVWAETTITVDGGEIHDHLWVTAAEAFDAHAAGRVELPAPTFVSLHRLGGYRSVADALARIPTEPYRRFRPRLVFDGTTQVAALYEGDVGFCTEGEVDLHADGPRHRLWVSEIPWRYELSPTL